MACIALKQWHGRLGNQLFQAAGVLAAALSTGRAPLFPPHPDFTTLSFYDPKEFVPDQTIALETPHAPLDLSALKGQKVQVDGYFQHAASLLPERTRIRGILLKDQQKEEKGVCAVHVRRGDYLGPFENAKEGISLPWSYYESSVAYAEKHFRVAQYVFYSDDRQFVLHKLKETKGEILKGAKGELAPAAKSDWEELKHMARAEFHIIGNSTFSWMARFLSANEHDHFVLPYPWFLHVPSSDLLLKGLGGARLLRLELPPIIYFTKKKKLVACGLPGLPKTKVPQDYEQARFGVAHDLFTKQIDWSLAQHMLARGCVPLLPVFAPIWEQRHLEPAALLSALRDRLLLQYADEEQQNAPGKPPPSAH